MSFQHKKTCHYYSLETKLRVIFAKKEGQTDKKIQKQFQIKNRKQICNWVKWFNNKQIYRLQQKRGHNYKYRQGINFIQNNNYHTFLKKQIQQKLKSHIKHDKELYLEIINQYQQKVSLNTLIKWLNISKTSYYRWLKNKDKPLFLTDLDLKIKEICSQNQYYNQEGKSFYIWGYRKVYVELLLSQMKVNPKTVYKKMKHFNFLCQTKKNRYLKRSFDKTYQPLSPLNLIHNNFEATEPYQKICADFTYLPYGNNKNLYLSTIMDLYNREIIAYHLSENCDTNLISKTLNQIPFLKKACLFHSDQGTQYTSKECQKTLKEKYCIPSFSEKGQPSQNACIESFFSNFKCEFFYFEKKNFLTKQYLIQKIHAFIK